MLVLRLELDWYINAHYLDLFVWRRSGNVSRQNGNTESTLFIYIAEAAGHNSSRCTEIASASRDKTAVYSVGGVWW
jgi:hypothetical protein